MIVCEQWEEKESIKSYLSNENNIIYEVAVTETDNNHSNNKPREFFLEAEKELNFNGRLR